MVSHIRLFVTLWTIACQAPVYGILQARILEWDVIPSSRESLTQGSNLASLISPALAGVFFTTIATWEAQETNIASNIFLLKPTPE